MSKQIVCDVCGKVIAREGGLTLDDTQDVRGYMSDGTMLSVRSQVEVTGAVGKDICDDCSWDALDAVRKAKGVTPA